MKTRLCVLMIALVAIWGLKRYYADAPVDDLHWILGPTARLVTIAGRDHMSAVVAREFKQAALEFLSAE